MYLILRIFVALFFAGTLFADYDRAVTYTFSYGRFGDNLLSYLHAKWISYTNDMPLLYKPFELSEGLVLSQLEKPYAGSGAEGWTPVELGRGRMIYKRTGGPTLYISPYFPEDPHELKSGRDLNRRSWPYFAVDWHHPGFRKVAREMIAPKENLKLLDLPQKKITIALHFRDGGDFDGPDMHLKIPLKFPPAKFYIEALREVFARFPGHQFYCYIFTDANSPEEVARRICEAFPPDAPIQFDWRKEKNHWDLHVLEDFFSLFLFDVLIHPQSNFSVVPTLIHTFAIAIAPKAFHMDKQKNVFIDEIDQQIDPELCSQIQLRCL
ncbi:MAG TPA: hypothetical protein VLE89_03145 [Chlamydiales bacterium]|nr:hypothetical protein [Chlamydiales bacterium]